MPRRVDPGSLTDNDITYWYRNVPTVTRSLISLAFLVSLVGYLKIISPDKLCMIWPEVTENFEIWRLVTSFFYLPVGIGSIFEMITLYRHSIDMETGIYVYKPMDYAFFIVFSIITSIGLSFLTSEWFLFDCLLLSILYLWSRHYPTRIVNFMFGFSFKGIYLPYAWLFLEFLFKGGVLPFGGFIGIASAYFYYYLKYEYPSQGGIDYLETPAFFRHTFQRLQNSGNTRRATQNTQNRYGARTPVEGDITNSTNPRRRAGVRLGGS